MSVNPRKLKPKEKIAKKIDKKPDEYENFIQKRKSKSLTVMKEDPAFVESEFVDATQTPDLAIMMNENLAKELDHYKTDTKRIQVRKETQEYYDEMTADERAKVLLLHPKLKVLMSIEEINLFISTGEIPEELLGEFK